MICYLVCLYGYYGEGCRYSCGGYCIRDELCDYVNGLCFNGC